MNIPISSGWLLIGLLTLSSCNIDAQKAPDLDQVVFNLQNRLQKAQGTSFSFNMESKNNSHFRIARIRHVGWDCRIIDGSAISRVSRNSTIFPTQFENFCDK
jgi:hypothetical protein